MTIDVWLKRIWLVIGILILAGFLVGVAAFLIQYFTSSQRVSGPLVSTSAQLTEVDSLVWQNLSFDSPRPVSTTGWLAIGVRIKDLSAPLPRRVAEMRLAKYPDYHEPSQRSLVNVVFTKADGSSSYPFLERKALIKWTDIPSPLDSLQRYALYEIAFLDTDHDGRITNEDSSQLYVSDVAGHNLVQVTPWGEVVQWHTKSSDYKQLFISVKHRPSADNIPLEDWPERLYAYDINNRKLSPFPADERTLETIRRRVWQ